MEHVPADVVLVGGGKVAHVAVAVAEDEGVVKLELLGVCRAVQSVHG